jgi:hypothetical protein
MEESVEKVRQGGVVKLRSDYPKMTDVNYFNLQEKVAELEQKISVLGGMVDSLLKPSKKEKDK